MSDHDSNKRTQWVNVDSFTASPSEGDKLTVLLMRSDDMYDVGEVTEVIIEKVGRHYSRPGAGQSGYKVLVSDIPEGREVLEVPRNQTPPQMRNDVQAGFLESV